MKEFFGFGGYRRPAEGFLSWQHLLFVGLLLGVMILLALWLGKKYKGRSIEQQNKVLIGAALLIDGFELFKIIILCLRSESLEPVLYNLPLFFCSIQLITIPLAAFSKGKVKEAALDFVCIFGILGAVFGTIGAGQNYSCYPVLSFDNVVSGVTHAISGFASLYISISRMATLKPENRYITFCILFSFAILAYAANLLLDYNYMFLMAGDGTPYDILYDLVKGNRLLYPAGVIGLFVLYIYLYYRIFCAAHQQKNKHSHNAFSAK